MKIKLRVRGLDGSDARELEEIIWSIPEVSDVKTRWRARDSLPPGEIHAVAATQVATVVVTYVIMKVADEFLKDAYKTGKAELLRRVEEYRAEKNKSRDPRHKIEFTVAEDGELSVKGLED